MAQSLSILSTQNDLARLHPAAAAFASFPDRLAAA
jgi:hypothetical protein